MSKRPGDGLTTSVCDSPVSLLTWVSALRAGLRDHCSCSVASPNAERRRTDILSSLSWFCVPTGSGLAPRSPGQGCPPFLPCFLVEPPYRGPGFAGLPGSATGCLLPESSALCFCKIGIISGCHLPLASPWRSLPTAVTSPQQALSAFGVDDRESRNSLPRGFLFFFFRSLWSLCVLGLLRIEKKNKVWQAALSHYSGPPFGAGGGKSCGLGGVCPGWVVP